MMSFFVILLLALDLRVFGFDYPAFVRQNSKDARVEVYSVVDSDKCPKIVQPLCGTNGKWFLYFENKCHFEAKNYELLTQGLMEYYECPLSLCQSVCPTCDLAYKPVCAVQLVTGEKKTFPNPCEVKRRICTTKKEWRIVNLFACNSIYENKILNPPNSVVHNPDCPEFCTLEYQPICARFLTLEKEFSNECELKTTICQTKQNWDIIKQGPCEPSHFNTVTESYAIDIECPRPCPLEYKPICAKLHNKFKVFNNKCEMENIICQGSDWQIIKEGTCFEGRNKPVEYNKCPNFCTTEYRPVCAEYKGKQREFGNSCELSKEICETNIKWKIVKFDTCSSHNQNALAIPDSCPIFCTREYKPVCAKFKNQIREFVNKCLLEKIKCESHKAWEIVYWGPCSTDSDNLISFESKCPEFCTREYRPVCAEFKSKLREFGNKCELQKTVCETNAAWKIFKVGPCPSSPWNTLPDSDSCPQFCSDDYKPVCAEFRYKLKEFENLCEMQKAICETNTNWQLLRIGHCPYVSEPKTSCPKFCTKDFSPICVRFNGELREFVNSCELQKSSCETEAAWELLNKGPCIVNQVAKLMKNPCENEVLDPICATYDFKTKTFNNICELAEKIKQTKNNWSILHKGICSNTSPATSTSVPAAETATTTSVADSSNTTATIILETATKPSHKDSAETNTTIEYNYTVEAKTPTTWKSTKYQTDTEPNETTTDTKTNSPKTTTTEYIKYSSIKPSTNGECGAEEVNREDVVDGGPGSHENISSSSNYITSSSFRFEENLDNETYTSWVEQKLNTSNSYETKSSKNKTDVKENSSTDIYEKYSTEDIVSTSVSNEAYESFSDEYEEEGIYSNQKYTGDYKSNEKYEESKDKEKDYNVAVKNQQEQGYPTNSKASQENEIELKIPRQSSILDRKEKLENIKNNILNRYRSGEVKKGATNFQATKYLERKSLTKWIKEQIQAILSRVANSQNSENSDSDEIYLYSPQNEKSDSNEIEEENSSYEEFHISDTKSHQMNSSVNLKSLNSIKETKAEIGVYSNKAYGHQNQSEDIKYSHNNMDNRCNSTNESSSTVNQSKKQTIHQTEQASKYSKRNETTDNTETNLNINEISIPKDNESIRTTLESVTTVRYTTNEETDTHHEQYPANYNSTKHRKGETYNGVVYKAPVYDAPTYNFIYTAPFNFHGFGTSHNNKSLVNQKVPFDPYHFLSSLPATSGSFAKPNFMPVHTAMGYKNNVPAYKHLLPGDNNQSKLPPSPFKEVSNKVLSEIHLIPPIVGSPPQGHFPSYLPPLNSNFDPKTENFLSSKKNEKYKNNYQPEESVNKHSVTEGYKSAVSTPPSHLPKDYVLSSTSSDVSHHPPVMPYHPPISRQLPISSPVNSPHISLNSTLLKKIVETLKIITNRY